MNPNWPIDAISHEARSAAPAPDLIEAVLTETRQAAGGRRRVRLRRIERLISSQPPRKAVLTLASVALATAFAALALPMGQAPAPVPRSGPAAAVAPPLPASAPIVHGSEAPREPAAVQLLFRNLFVDPYQFHEVIRPKLPVPEEHIPYGGEATWALRQWFAQLGVEMNLTNGASMFWHDDGRLMVYAPRADLDAIERAIKTMGKEYSGKPHPRLEIGVIRLVPDGFEAGLRKLKLLSEGANSLKEVSAAVLRRFAQLGVDLAPPKTCRYCRSRSGGYLAVCAPHADLEIIEPEVVRLHVAPAQLLIQVLFIELSKTETQAFWDQFRPAQRPGEEDGSMVATLTPSQAAARLRHWESLDQEAVIGRIKVTTLDGRQTRASTLSTSLTSSFAPGFTNTALPPFGPMLDFVPTLVAGSDRMRLELDGSNPEFRHDDGPGQPMPPVARGRETAPQTPPRPPTLLRFRHAKASLEIEDGQTAVLGGLGPGPTAERDDAARTQSQVPPLLDLPITASQPEKPGAKELIVLVTPTVIDPLGNKVRPRAEK